MYICLYESLTNINVDLLHITSPAHGLFVVVKSQVILTSEHLKTCEGKPSDVVPICSGYKIGWGL